MVSITPLSRSLSPLTRLLICLVLALGSALLHADTLSASVDRSRLALDETLTLTLRFDSRDTPAEPDTRALEPFFDILGRNQSRQVRSINGKTSAFTLWQYSLAPKQLGLIQLPAFELNGERSEALQVEVTAPRPGTSTSGDYFLERDLQPDSLYPGQQLRVRVRLNTAVGLSDLQITPLSVEGAKLVELEDRQYQRTLNGRPYLVYEKNYALFARQPGTLELPAQTLTATKGGSRSVFDLNRGQAVRLRTEAQQIEVQAPPVTATDDWLVADSLRLKQWLETGATSVYAGEPVTLNLSLEAEGADPARLPALVPPALDGLRLYPEPVDDQQQAGANGLHISRTQRVGLVPTQPGTLTLPPRQVRWWNSQRGEFDEARSEPITLTVLPPRQASMTAPGAATGLTAPGAMAAGIPGAEPAPGVQTGPRQSAEPLLPWLLWSNLAWAGLCGLLTLAWWRARRSPATAETPSAITADSPNRKQAEQQLRQACRQGSPAQLRQAILHWADAIELTGTQPATLARLAALGDAALRAELAALDRALFAPGSGQTATTKINTERLLTGLKALQGNRNQAASTSALAELYPQ